MKSIVINHRIDWMYCDPAGIIFYPTYYAWFDQATEHLFSGNGLTYEVVREKYNALGFHLVESGATYKHPCKHGQMVELHSHVEEWSGKTFVVRHRILHEDGTEAVNGFERRAWVVAAPERPRGIKAIEVPQEVMDLFVD